MLKPEDFYLQQNREIYEAIYTMFNLSQTIDPVTVLDKLKRAGAIDDDNSRDYILQLMEITPTAANVARYAAIVQEKSLLRRTGSGRGRTFSRWCRKRRAPPAEMLEAAEQRIYALRKGEPPRATLWSTSARRHAQGVRPPDRAEPVQDALIPGLSTGLRDLDTRHLRPEQVRPACSWPPGPAWARPPWR